MIDLHCHVLAGIDDGPATVEQSLALARAAAAAGTSTLLATPHVSARYPNDAETIGRLVAELQRRLSGAGIPLEVRAGAEVSLAQLRAIAPEELSRLRLGGGPWLLLEPPLIGSVPSLLTVLSELQQEGHRVLLAHPERCRLFHRDPRMLEAAVDAGALTSVTAGSLAGRFGETVQRFALQLAHRRLVHNVASDAHDDARRAPGMAVELEQAGMAALADWHTQAVPAAILAGREIPPRPDVEIAELAPAPGRNRRRASWRALLGARPVRRRSLE